MADNIFDKTYASSYVIRRSASEAMPTYLAGNGRSFFGGVKYNF
jgi:iron complex outermembrane receptor protein